MQHKAQLFMQVIRCALYILMIYLYE